MTIRIKDGTGTGDVAKVRGGRVAVSAESISIQAHASLLHQQAYQAPTGVQNIAGAGAFGLLALRNDNSTLSAVVTYIRIGIDDNEVAQALLQVYLRGTWVGGTPLSDPVNVNTRGSNLSNVVAHTNSIPTGADLIDSRWAGGPSENTWNKEGSIVIPPNGVISLKVTTETASVNAHGRISFVMLSDEQVAGV